MNIQSMNNTCQCATRQSYVHFVSAQAIIWYRTASRHYYAKSHRLDQDCFFSRRMMAVGMCSYCSRSVNWTIRTSVS